MAKTKDPLPAKRLPGFHPSRSRAIRHQQQAYVVGVPTDLAGSMYQQTKQALASVDEALQKIGLASNNIALVVVYVSDMGQKADMNRAWEEWASRENPPVRACVGVALEPGCLVEMMVTATVDKAR
jgi:enamine deaminase RidA (YjgF/YER057c/UK114 family)